FRRVLFRSEALGQLDPAVPLTRLRLHVADFPLQFAEGDELGVDHGDDPVTDAGGQDRKSAEQARPQGQDREGFLQGRRWHESVERRYGVAAAGLAAGISETGVGMSATRSLALDRSNATNSS